jgi:hypothetical protein
MNSLTVQYALDYEKEGFTFMALSPGVCTLSILSTTQNTEIVVQWMKTDLGGGEMADLTAEEGAKASLDIIFRPGQELNGQFPKVLVKGWEKAEGNNQYDGSNSAW